MKEKDVSKKEEEKEEDSIMEDIESQFSDGIESNMPGDAAPNMGRNFKRAEEFLTVFCVVIIVDKFLNGFGTF